MQSSIAPGRQRSFSVSRGGTVPVRSQRIHDGVRRTIRSPGGGKLANGVFGETIHLKRLIVAELMPSRS